MGYTHYWRRTKVLPRAQFDAWRRDVAEMLRGLPARNHGGGYPDAPLILRGPSGEGEPVNDSLLLAFNGSGEHDGTRLDHEDFWMAQEIGPSDPGPTEDGRYFEFCKTAMAPYDLAVCAALILAAHHFGPALTVRSDGEAEDWADALGVCLSTVGYGMIPRGVRCQEATP